MAFMSGLFRHTVPLSNGQLMSTWNMSRNEGRQATTWKHENGAILRTNGRGDDNVSIRYNCDGSATVTVNGEEHEFTAGQMESLTIETGDGNDTVTVELEHSEGLTG